MLQGTLKDFRLSEVLRLLASGRKSGGLRLASEAVAGCVFFGDGAVTFAVSDDGAMPLVARMVAAGDLAEEALVALITRHSDRVVDLVKALVNSAEIDRDLLAVFMREQIIDALFQLLPLEAGHFVFESEDAAPVDGVSLAVDDLVDQVTRMQDQWGALQSRVGSLQAVAEALPVGDGGEVTMVREQWELLAFIDGRRTLAEVAALSGKGRFATCEIVAELIDLGLVKTVQPAAGGRTRLATLAAAHEALRGIQSHPVDIAPISEPSPRPVSKPLDRAKDDSTPRAVPAALPRTLQPATAPPPVPAAVPATDPVVVPVNEDAAALVRRPDAPAAAVGAHPMDPRRLSAPEVRPAARPLDRAEAARELAALSLEDSPSGSWGTGPAKNSGRSHFARARN